MTLQASSHEDFEERKGKEARLAKKAAKSSGSRLLQKVAKSKEERPKLEIALGTLDDLFFAMTGKIRNGEMEWSAALDDFMKGAKALKKEGNPFHTSSEQKRLKKLP